MNGYEMCGHTRWILKLLLVLCNIKVICSWVTGPGIQKVLWWKCNTRQCALPMGTQPDIPNPFVQGSIPIDLNDIGVVQWAEIVWFLPASLMQDKEDCKSIPLIPPPPSTPPSSLQFKLQYNGLKNPVWPRKKKKGPAHLKMTLQ